MPIRTRCSCGSEAVYPDTLEGREMRCRKCRQRVTVAGEKIADPHRVSWARRLTYFGIALAFTIGVLWFVMWAVGPHFTPVAELYENGSRTPIEPRMDETRIRIVLDAAATAVSEGLAIEFAKYFHFKRMLAEVETRGGLALIAVKRHEEEVLDELDVAVRTFCGTTHRNGIKWSPIKRASIRFLDGRGEAEVTAVLRNGPNLLRYRFWLIKEEQVWAIFDFENLDAAARLSSMMGKALRRVAKDPLASYNDRDHWASLNRAMDLAAKQKPEEALSAVESIPTSNLPALLFARREILRATILHGLGRQEEALSAVDVCLLKQKDMPEAVFLRSQIFFQLHRYPECIQAGEAYLRLIGPDASACVWIASAWDELKKPEGAVEVFRRLLAAAPDLAEELERIDGIEEFQKRPEIAEAMKRAKAVPPPK